MPRSAFARRRAEPEAPPTPMATYGYARLSRLRPDEEGNSLDDQRRRIEGRAMEYGTDVAHLFVDKNVSGSIPLALRPEGKKLLARVKPGDRVISPKLDRTFRDTRDALEMLDWFRERKIGLVLLDLGGDVTADDGIGELLFTILAAVGKWERGRIIERIRESKEWGREHRRYLGGGRPFGFQIVERDGVKYVEADLAEQEAIKTMRRRMEQGESINSLLKWANEQGHQITYRALYKLLTSDE